ncbi:MAG: hypothetical protein ABIK30_11990 [bacterium]
MVKIFFIIIACTILGYGKDNHIVDENKQNIFMLDTIITKSKNLTILGRNDQIIYHLLVEDWEKPVRWSLYLLSNQDTLYQISSYDVKINHLFKEPIYIGNRESDYIECKKTWYLNTIHNFYIDTVQVDEIKKRLLFIETSKYFARNNKNEYGENLEKSMRNWEIFWEYYYNRPMIIFVVRSAPEGYSTPLLVYHPLLNKLVPIYHP